MQKIRVLPPIIANRIAAGEVVDRPASVIKELIENALDAGATQIDCVIEEAGKKLILVQDNGYGMSKESLSLCIERHATSKLPDDNLFSIINFGFRGEALPSIASVSRLKITSKEKGEVLAWSLLVEAGQVKEVIPDILEKGTKVEIRDLFYPTPARLKFLKADKTEMAHITETIQRLSLANPGVGFSLKNNGQMRFSLPNQLQASDPFLARLEQVFSKELSGNVIPLDKEQDEIRIHGYIGLPTYNHKTSQNQYFYVNGRSVRDKVLLGAVKAAYQDFVPHGRHPSVILFLEMPYDFVDVNVHPAKAEVRFRQSGVISRFLVSCLKSTLVNMGCSVASTGEEKIVVAMEDYLEKKQNASPFSKQDYDFPKSYSKPSSFHLNEKGARYQAPIQSDFIGSTGAEPSVKSETYVQNTEYTLDEDFPLGAACAQVHKTYILSQTKEGMVLTDQHAAHERIVYEKMKQQSLQGRLAAQKLLMPIRINLPLSQQEGFQTYLNDFEALGFDLEVIDDGIIVHATPYLFGQFDVAKMIKDLAAEIEDMGTHLSAEKLLTHVCGTYACHHSIRAGRQLSIEEMNALLREIEAMPNTGQCNHGRPTHIHLSLKAIENLFERS